VKRSVKKKHRGGRSAVSERKNEVGPKQRSGGHHHPIGAAVAVAEAVIALPLRPPDQDPIHHLLDHIPRHPAHPLPIHTPVVHLDLLRRAPEAAVEQEMIVVQVTEKEHTVVAVQVQSDHIRAVVAVARTEEAGKNDLGDQKVLTRSLDHPKQWK
jgi:hypothetical protein